MLSSSSLVDWLFAERCKARLGAMLACCPACCLPACLLACLPACLLTCLYNTEPSMAYTFHAYLSRVPCSTYRTPEARATFTSYPALQSHSLCKQQKPVHKLCSQVKHACATRSSQATWLLLMQSVNCTCVFALLCRIPRRNRRHTDTHVRKEGTCLSSSRMHGRHTSGSDQSCTTFAATDRLLMESA